jgi:hypothetical protein
MQTSHKLGVAPKARLFAQRLKTKNPSPENYFPSYFGQIRAFPNRRCAPERPKAQRLRSENKSGRL